MKYCKECIKNAFEVMNTNRCPMTRIECPESHKKLGIEQNRIQNTRIEDIISMIDNSNVEYDYIRDEHLPEIERTLIEEMSRYSDIRSMFDLPPGENTYNDGIVSINKINPFIEKELKKGNDEFKTWYDNERYLRNRYDIKDGDERRLLLYRRSRRRRRT